MKKILLKITLGVVFVCLLSCSSDEPLRDSDPIELSAAQTRAAEEINGVGLKLLKTINEENRIAGKTENIFFCPVSIGTDLALIANAAYGETKDEIINALGLTDLDDLNSFYATALPSFQTMDRSVKLALANSVWTREDVPVKDEFKNRMQGLYGADFFSYKLSENPAKSLNQWCSQHTFGVIPKIADETLPFPLKMSIWNATYFNARWTDPFNKSATTNDRYYDEDGNIIGRVDFMHKDDRFKCYTAPSWYGIEIPYGNGTFVMTAIIPEDGSTVSEILEIITPEDFAGRGNATINFYKINLYIPKFKAESDLNITKVLTSVGINKLLGGNPDLSKMTDAQLNDLKVIHKACVIVDEEGTEAAAVTGTFAISSPGPGETVKFNRPFIYMIREVNTQTILFAGVMNNPKL